MGDTVNAMNDYQAALRLEPEYSLAYYNAANLYFKQRQFKQVYWWILKNDYSSTASRQYNVVSAIPYDVIAL